LSDRVRFHVGRGLVKQAAIRDEDQIMTLLNKRKIRFNVYMGKDDNGDMVSYFLILSLFQKMYV
jgi:hypothetical protein